LAVETIEKVHAVGYDHLIDKNLVKKRQGLNGCVSFCSKFLLFLLFAALVTFTVLYFVKEFGGEP